ncbi:hypothetical protein [Ornithobacterium rhinotracheale]|uniref:hypothetical protein n=1 Tax=Ornithobacterium rhinotracheale TaxID=28251 RepID=UPI001FF6BAD7|nr:hypothetical protein [Ornithobacterium rhinotracheale]MCK0204232.1 hypothetical protein [Ornithobacterium rhinotracheale]
MKKNILIVSLFVGGLVYGQINVQTGLDTSIGNENPFLDASGYNRSSNNIGKGLYFPTTDLTKWEFKTDGINPGKFKNYFDGMVVYNTGEGSPTTDASKGGIRKNLTRGFYYFKNPNQNFPKGSVKSGEWVRLSDAQALQQASLWANDASAKVAKLKTLSDGTTERADDKNIFVTDEGKVGMGTKKPTEKLEVNGNAKITQMPNASQKEKEFTNAVVAKPDGTLGVVKRATTPNIPSGTEVVFGNPMESTDIMPNETFYSIQENSGTRGGDLYRYSGQSITLPPGNWVVYCAYLVTSRKGLEKNDSYIFPQNASVWLRAIIDDSKDNGSYTTATINGSPTLISCSLNSGDLFQVASGVWLINNSGSSPKTYYVKVSIEPNGYFNSSSSSRLQNLSKWLEDYIFAIKRN